MRVKVIFFYLPHCKACKAFEKNVLLPLYRRGDIYLTKVNVGIEKEVKEMRMPIEFENYRLHYDVACAKSPTGCVVPAVEIPIRESNDEYESKFVFTDGNEKEFEKKVIKAVEDVTMRRIYVVG